MKRCLLIAMLLLVALAAYANPLVARVIERVYFDANGDLWVRIGTEATYMLPFDAFEFSTSQGIWPIPDDYSLPTILPADINLNQMLPGFAVLQAEDHLILDLGGWNEAFYWGPASDFSVDLHPLTTGQSAVQIRQYAPDGDTQQGWAKDNHLVSPEEYYPASRCTINVIVTNQSGSYAAGVPVFLSDFYGWTGPYPTQVSDANGSCHLVRMASRYYMVIKDPLTNEDVFSENLYPEPDQTITIMAVVSGTAADDPVQSPAAPAIIISPNLLGRSTGSVARIDCSSGGFASQGGELRLYDLRGRVIGKRALPDGGITQWDLSDLDSGIYFIGLLQHGKVTAKSRVTIIK